MDLRIYSQKLAPAFMALRIELLDGVDWEIADRRSQIAVLAMAPVPDPLEL